MLRKLVFIILFFISSIFIVHGGWHLANQIVPGQFATGDYNFDGDVGIGTASPDSKLHILAPTTGVARIEGSGGASGLGAVLYLEHDSDYRGRGIFMEVPGDGDWYAGVPYTGAGYSIGFDASGGQPYYDANSLIFVEEGGDIGIGTSSPAFDLDIQDSAEASLNILSTAGNARLELRASGNDYAYIDFSNDASEDYGARILAREQPGNPALTYLEFINANMYYFSGEYGDTRIQVVGDSNAELASGSIGSGASLDLRDGGNGVGIYLNPETDTYFDLKGTDGLVIGTTSTIHKFEVYDNAANYVAKFRNYGGTTGSKGVVIQGGPNDGSGTTALLGFWDGDGTWIGGVTTSGGVATYGAFTANHEASIPDDYNEDGYDYGTILCLDKTTINNETLRQPLYSVSVCKKANDKSVFGIYSGKYEDKTNLHIIYSAGDGHILVTKEGGNIEIGDYLTSSNKAGYGMKQDDDFLHTYTIAKATQEVNWDEEENDTKLIACTYHSS